MSRTQITNNQLNDGLLKDFFTRILNYAIGDIDCGWLDVLIPQGLAECALAIGDEEMLRWVRTWTDYQLAVPSSKTDRRSVEGKGKQAGFVLNDYCGNWGGPMVFAPLYQMTKDPRYREAMDEACETILHRSIRPDKKVIAHGGAIRSAVWVDTLYYTASPLAMSYRMTGNETYAREAIQQCLLHSELLRDETSGCFIHDVDLETGQRAHCFWSRGNGWIIMALADTLRNVPPELDGWSEVLKIYRSLCTALLRYQHASGIWRVIPELDYSHLETSGSAMILTGLTIGLNERWLEPWTLSNVLRGYEELKTWIDPRSGALMGSQFPAGQGGWDVHKRAMLGECTYASGVFMRLIAELEKFRIQNDNGTE